MTYFGPPPPPEKKRTTTVVLIVVGVLAALCCGGAVIGGFVLAKSVTKAIGPVREAADSFLGDLEAGDTSTAYAALCSPARTEFTPAQFEQVLAARPKITEHKIASVNVGDFNGKVTGTVGAQLRYADGSSELQQFRLTKEGDSWHVCGHPY